MLVGFVCSFDLSGKQTPSTVTQEQSFGSFSTEVARVNSALACDGRVTPSDQWTGALYGCIKGNEETAKFWINESKRMPGTVENIKVMWNEAQPGGITPERADMSSALSMVNVMSQLYLPGKSQQLTNLFLSDAPTKMAIGGYDVEFTFSVGPLMNERVLKLSKS